MRWIALAIALILIFGCDPGFFKRFPVDASSARSPIEKVLVDFEREHLGSDFFRVDVPHEIASDYRERGYRVLRWYDRDPVATYQRGSFAYLAVLVDIETAQIELASAAFPSFGEPPQLKRLRGQLSQDLCEYGFIMKDGCDN